jgi:aspartokinase-like uncharacterized kinase
VTPLVLKLGGSLAESGRLRSLLMLVSRARRPLVIVPGGGPFADAVREMQAALRFPDDVAHDMAILAMHQMADAMIALEPRFVATDTLVAMSRAWRRRLIPVWLPAKLCASDRRIPRDWSITSDGLAARLAERLGDAEVALVKSRAVPRTAHPGTLARHGVVDSVFPLIVERAGLTWHVVGPGDEAVLGDLLDAAPKVSDARAARRRGVQSTGRGSRDRGVGKSR